MINKNKTFQCRLSTKILRHKIWKTKQYRNRNVVQLCKWLPFCRMFLKSDTNETLVHVSWKGNVQKG